MRFGLLALMLAACGGPPTAAVEEALGADAWGTGRQDMVWQRLRSNSLWTDFQIWHYNGPGSAPTKAPLSRSIPNLANVEAAGDVFGDGHTALVIRQTDNIKSNYLLWRLNGPTVVSDQLIARDLPAEWAVVAVFDVDRDGREDLVWRNVQTGELGFWLMNGASVRRYITVRGFPADRTQSFIGVGRIDGTSVSVLMRNSANDVVAYQLTSEGDYVFSIDTIGSAVPAEWKTRGMGDFDGDGKSDILWWNSRTGDSGIWLMSWVFVKAYRSPGGATLNWQVIGAGDYDGDRRADILWRDGNTGEVGLWPLNADATAVRYYGHVDRQSCEWRMIQDPTNLSLCVDSGGLGQHCWNGGCNPGLTCIQNQCYDPNYCGQINEPCCFGADHVCPGSNNNDLVCQDGLCRAAPPPAGCTTPAFPLVTWTTGVVIPDADEDFQISMWVANQFCGTAETTPSLIIYDENNTALQQFQQPKFMLGDHQTVSLVWPIEGLPEGDYRMCVTLTPFGEFCGWFCIAKDHC